MDLSHIMTKYISYVTVGWALGSRQHDQLIINIIKKTSTDRMRSRLGVVDCSCGGQSGKFGMYGWVDG